MKIEQLGLDKVKVILSQKDLEEMNVDPHMFMSDTGALQAFILNILNEIYRKTNFNPYKGNITMEAMPDDNGMSILLSRREIGETEHPNAHVVGMRCVTGSVSEPGMAFTDKSGFVRPKKKHGKIKGVCAVKADNSIKNTTTFIFDKFEDMCEAVTRMSGVCAAGAELYKLDGAYALLVPVRTANLDDIAMIMEFASQVKRAMVHEHVREHGISIAKGDELAAMIEGIRKIV